MRGGNISNDTATSIGLRYEGLINQEGQLNRAAKAFLEDLFYKSINIYILTMLDERKVKAFCLKWAVPYTAVIKIDTEFEFAEVCQEQGFLTYYDVDEQVLQTVGLRGKNRTKAELWTPSAHY